MLEGFIKTVVIRNSQILVGGKNLSLPADLFLVEAVLLTTDKTCM